KENLLHEQSLHGGDRHWNAGKAGSFAIVSWHDRRCAPRGPAVGAIGHALGAFPPVHAGVRDAADTTEALQPASKGPPFPATTRCCAFDPTIAQARRGA